jgi:hypothetical protein
MGIKKSPQINERFSILTVDKVALQQSLDNPNIVILLIRT